MNLLLALFVVMQILNIESVDEFRERYTEYKPVMEAIGHCESNNIYTGQDGDLSNRAPRSTASGRFRFIDGTWAYVWNGYIGISPPTERAKDAHPLYQDLAFVMLYEREGLTPWEASRHCWESQL